MIPEVLLEYREHESQANWVRQEQRILSVLGAQFAASERSAGRPDSFRQTAPISAQTLIDLGVPPSDIEAALITGSRNAAIDALGAGNGKAARSALKILFGQPGLRWKTRLHGCLLGARSLFN